MVQNRDANVANLPKTQITPAFQSYLRTQMLRMQANGASEEDLARWMTLELERGEQAPRIIAPQTAFNVDASSTFQKPSMLRGLSMKALQGITFGFGDEAMGSILGVLTGEGARGGINTYRRELEAFTAEHPRLGIAAEIGGSVLTGGTAVKLARQGLAKVGLRGTAAAASPLAAAPLEGSAQAVARAAGPTLGQRIATAGRQGAGFGAAFGAGHQEGDISLEGISDRAKAALFGGTFGAALGLGLGAGIGVLGTVTRPIARAAVGSATNWQRAIQQRLPGVNTAEQHAKEMLVRGLVQDGVTIEEATRRIMAMQTSGTTPTLLDIAGDATLRLGKETVSSRTPAKQRLAEILLGRQAEQGDRISTRLFSQIFRGDRLGLRNVEEASSQLHAARKALSAGPYQQAFQETVEITPRMRQILSTKAFQRAYNIGRQIAEDIEAPAGIGIGLDIPLLPNIQRTLGATTPEGAAAVAQLQSKLFPTSLPVRALDYTKRGLDAVIRKGFEGKSIDKPAARGLRSMLNELLGAVDDQVPTYAEARAIYRGFSEADDALQLGREFLGQSPDKVRQIMNGLAPQERDFYRLGAANALYQQVTNVANEGADIARNYFGGRLFGGTSKAGERIRALFVDAPEVADDFMRMVAAETRISHTSAATRGAVRGSLQAAEEVAEGSTPVVRGGGLVTGAVLTAASAGRTGVQRLRGAWLNDVTDELSLLFTKGLNDPRELSTLLDELATIAARNKSKALSGSGLASGFLTGHLFGN